MSIKIVGAFSQRFLNQSKSLVKVQIFEASLLCLTTIYFAVHLEPTKIAEGGKIITQKNHKIYWHCYVDMSTEKLSADGSATQAQLHLLVQESFYILFAVVYDVNYNSAVYV